jgi:hypothetical protein
MSSSFGHALEARDDGDVAVVEPRRTLSLSMPTMRARVCAASVRIPACSP